ncbi:hypothetical protein HAX54_029616 [Datura stramonium]|uniref:Uncharacterized protein n=1 Tax=Datura stramonium TaxID=4076 RepID=A0ABS8V6M1_DATST|nr:hypothetical protein [Datura stramonium]
MERQAAKALTQRLIGLNSKGKGNRLSKGFTIDRERQADASFSAFLSILPIRRASYGTIEFIAGLVIQSQQLTVGFRQLEERSLQGHCGVAECEQSALTAFDQLAQWVGLAAFRVAHPPKMAAGKTGARTRAVCEDRRSNLRILLSLREDEPRLRYRKEYSDRGLWLSCFAYYRIARRACCKRSCPTTFFLQTSLATSASVVFESLLRGGAFNNTSSLVSWLSENRPKAGPAGLASHEMDGNQKGSQKPGGRGFWAHGNGSGWRVLLS